SECYGRALLAPASGQPPELRRAVRPLGAAGRLGGRHQRPPQPAVAVPGFAAAPLACALVVTRAAPGPGGQVRRRGEAVQVHPEFRDYKLSDPPAPPGWYPAAPPRLRKGAAAPGAAHSIRRGWRP